MTSLEPIEEGKSPESLESIEEGRSPESLESIDPPESQKSIDPPSPSSSMKTAAILIGINYTKCRTGKLRGCHNDVDLMEKYLVELRGYAKQDILKCVDLNNTRDLYLTSRQGMLENLYDLALRSFRDELDEVFITYSGHGSQVKDYSGKEEDGMNEILLPWDFRTKGYIMDDTIHHILKQMNPKTRVICIFDCCHSGSMADLEFKYTFDREKNEIATKRIKHNAIVPNVITLSGCKDCQVSMDAYNVRGRRQFSGAMTACFTKVMRGIEGEQRPKLFDVFGKLHDLLGDKEFVQMPVLFSSKVLTESDLF